MVAASQNQKQTALRTPGRLVGLPKYHLNMGASSVEKNTASGCQPWACQSDVWGFEQSGSSFAGSHIIYIYQFIYTNQNLLYTAGVSRILGLQICSPTVGPCSYKSKEACNFSEYKAKRFIWSTGCQHIRIWYISGTYITHTKHIVDQKKQYLVTLNCLNSFGHAAFNHLHLSDFTLCH